MTETAAATREVDAPGSGGLAFALSLAYLFLLFSRLPELVSAVTGNLYLVFITGFAALALSVANGRSAVALRSNQAIWLLAFSGWLLVCTFMSFWPGGSFNLLTQTWSKSLMAFFVVAGSIGNLNQCKRAFAGVAAGLVVVEILSRFMGAETGGRFDLGTGTLGNANALAFHTVFTLPFVLLMAMHGKRLTRIVALPIILYGIMMVLQTGSRSGLLGLTTVTAGFFLRVRTSGKILMVMSAALLATFLSLNSIVGQGALDRYKTLFSSSDETESQAYVSAAESAEARKTNLGESIRVTFQNPIFGVGPGVFAPALAVEFDQHGRPALWRETHNAYTQVSSESGLPGFLMYITVVLLTLKTALGLYWKSRKHPQEKLVADLSFCLLLSVLAFIVNGLFDSNAYAYYFPVLAGLSVAVKHSAEAASNGAPELSDNRLAVGIATSRTSVDTPGRVPVGVPSFKGGLR